MMSTNAYRKYWILTILAMVIALPVALTFIFALTAGGGIFSLFGVLLFLLLIYLIYRVGKGTALPDTFLLRYAPLIAPILVTLVAWLVMASVNGGNFTSLEKPINFGLFIFLPFFALLFFDEPYWLLPVAAIGAYLLFIGCFALGTWRSQRLRTTGNKPAPYALALILALAAAATAQGYVQYHGVLHPDRNHPELKESSSWADDKLISPATPPSLQIDGDYPRLDGAEALIPVYAAAAKAIYRKSEAQGIDFEENTPRYQAVKHSQSTPEAYRGLLSGKVDMIFAAAPSEEQKQDAAANGMSYTLTPIGKEAFVFLVNEHNPVTSLSVEQLHDIYSGKINDWKEVGGGTEKIMAFQRNEGSGSQTAMLRNVMRGTPMRKPLEAEYVSGMDGLLRGVASYRNYGNAIGYSFRYYATIMNAVPGIRLLAVNGIAPTVENIRNGSYPFTEDFYIVTIHPLSGNAAKLRDWFVGDEGQRFIEEVGYVPLASQPH